MNNRFILLLTTVICLLGGTFAPANALAGEVMAAVASNFIKPMQKIATEFKTITGHDVKISFGSSGKLLAQITHGAPFDIFLSADKDKVERLLKQGLAIDGSDYIYARGRLVLWSADTDYIGGNSDILRRGDFKYIALADAKLAPYGQAANEVMQSLAVDKLLNSKLITGENISQTYQFVSTGNAELGFVAFSQVKHLTKQQQGSHWLVPPELHQPIAQSAVLLKRAKNSLVAREFLDFLQKHSTQTLIKSFGYDTSETMMVKSYADAR